MPFEPRNTSKPTQNKPTNTFLKQQNFSRDLRKFQIITFENFPEMRNFRGRLFSIRNIRK